MPATADEQKTRVRVVATRACTTTKGKRGVIFRRVLAGGELSPADLVFSGRDTLRCRPGSMFDCDAALGDDGKVASIWFDSLTFVGRYDDKAAVLQWAAETQARDTAEAAERALRNEAKRNVIEEAIEPLRRVYRRMPAPQQRALETCVLMALRRKARGD